MCIRDSCLYKGSIPNVKVYETDLKKIQNSEYMENLRQQFKDGIRPTNCQSCWQEEDAGKTSKRMNSLYKMKNSLLLILLISFCGGNEIVEDPITTTTSMMTLEEYEKGWIEKLEI